MGQEKILDLGCGQRKRSNSVGLDQFPLEGVDIVHDMNKYPYPIEDNSFDRIILTHVVEHIPDLVGLMEEVHRIGRRNALVEIETPHFTSANSYTDPTHVHHLSLLAFDFFCGGTEHGYVTKGRFVMKEKKVSFWPLHDKLGWIPYHTIGLHWFVQSHPVFYERFLAFLFPLKEFRVVLQIDK